jgi:hypothetical protein
MKDHLKTSVTVLTLALVSTIELVRDTDGDSDAAEVAVNAAKALEALTLAALEYQDRSVSPLGAFLGGFGVIGQTDPSDDADDTSDVSNDSVEADDDTDASSPSFHPGLRVVIDGSLYRGEGYVANYITSNTDPEYKEEYDLPQVRVRADNGKLYHYHNADIENGIVKPLDGDATSAEVTPAPTPNAPAAVAALPTFEVGQTVQVNSELYQGSGTVNRVYPSGKPGKEGQPAPHVSVRGGNGRKYLYNADDIRANRLVAA